MTDNEKQSQMAFNHGEDRAPDSASQEHYGQAETDRICSSGRSYNELSAIEKFTLNNGWRYATQEALQAAFARRTKSELLTEEEFLEEAGAQEMPSAKKAYQVLSEMARNGMIDSAEVYLYAHYRLCIDRPEVIIAYREVFSDAWRVNKCAEEASPEKALLFLNRDFGFEASRICIIGVPYYDATDYYYIRFDCGGIHWLAQDGELYRVDGCVWKKSWQADTSRRFPPDWL